MDTVELFQRFSVAVAIGLLIGLERGWQERSEPEGGRSAGLRTLALSGLLGAGWGALALSRGPGGLVALGIAFAVYSVAIGVFRFRETAAEGTFGATTLVAGMLSFTLGAFAVMGDAQVAAAAGVATAALLALKRALHDWVRRLTWEELRSALVLAAMTFVLLPVLPDRAVPVLGGLNPFEIWLMTILIAAISFAGYVAVKVAGSHTGIVLTGLAAGLVSSTAATITLARMARENPARSDLLTGGALIAGATMVARVVAVIATFNLALLPIIAPALAVGGAVLAAAAILLVQRSRGVAEAGEPGDEAAPMQLANPFEITTVLQFGALLALIMLATRLVIDFAGAGGLVLLAAVSGIADVDAITLTMSRQAAATGPGTAGLAILAAVAANTLAKAGLAWVTGGPAVGRPMLAAALLAVLCGGLAAAYANVYIA